MLRERTKKEASTHSLLQRKMCLVGEQVELYVQGLVVLVFVRPVVSLVCLTHISSKSPCGCSFFLLVFLPLRDALYRQALQFTRPQSNTHTTSYNGIEIKNVWPRVIRSPYRLLTTVQFIQLSTQHRDISHHTFEHYKLNHA